MRRIGPIGITVGLLIAGGLVADGLSVSQRGQYKCTGAGCVPRTIANKLSDSVSIKDFGAVGDGVTDDSTAVANAIASSGSNQFIGFDCPGNFKTTLYGTLPCGDYYPPLAATGGYPRSLPNKIQDIIDVRDFGADPAGATDSTTALQNAFNAVSNSGGYPGRNLYIPHGTYLYSTMITANQLRTMTVYGDGNRNTILRWTGAAGGTAFLCQNCYRVVLVGMRFERSTNDPAKMLAFREDKNQVDYDATAPSQLNVLRECTIKNGQVGLAIDLPSGAVAGDDIMNDTHLIDHNIMDSQSTANVQINGANALNIGFTYNYFSASPVGVQVLSAPAGGGGSFNWVGGYITSTSINFDIQGTSTDGYNIRKVRSEGSPRFIQIASTTVSSPITIDSVYYSASSLHADTFAINALGGGPFVIRGSMWGASSSGTPPVLKFNTPAPTEVLLEVNAFEVPGSDATAHTSIGSSVRLTEIGSRCKTAGLARVICAPNPMATSSSPLVVVTYATGSATSLGAPDLTAGSMFTTVATTNVQFGFANPTGGAHNQVWCAQIKNTSGGALNAASPFQDTKFRATAWTSPVTAKNQTRCFFYNKTADVHYEISVTGDVGN